MQNLFSSFPFNLTLPEPLFSQTLAIDDFLFPVEYVRPCVSRFLESSIRKIFIIIWLHYFFPTTFLLFKILKSIFSGL